MTDYETAVVAADAVDEEETDAQLAEQLRGHWAKVEETLPTAKAMHFDGCHKIYLSMDNAQVKEMKEYGYDAVEPNLEMIRRWFEDSCPLRLISAVHTNERDPNAGFVQLIPQGY
ncbi:hypothetical protein [Arthrobacter koreensis]|uniref:hypothetical protein n=1 Tax=Arthrobacter koreensis TaxID=199136 RepID=UPI0038046B34